MAALHIQQLNTTPPTCNHPPTQASIPASHPKPVERIEKRQPAPTPQERAEHTERGTLQSENEETEGKLKKGWGLEFISILTVEGSGFCRDWIDRIDRIRGNINIQ